MPRIAPWLLAGCLFYPLCAAAGDPPADPAAPGECAEPKETPIRSGNADEKPEGQDEALRALAETASQRRARQDEAAPVAEPSKPEPSGSETPATDPAPRSAVILA